MLSVEMMDAFERGHRHLYLGLGDQPEQADRLRTLRQHVAR